MNHTTTSSTGLPPHSQPGYIPALQPSLPRYALSILNSSAVFWFLVASIGQLMFVAYIVSFYGTSGIQGNFENWNKVMPRGYVPGDLAGNIAVVIHIFFAAIITLGGPIQFIPQVRTYAPTFHRWNGRVYATTAVVASLTGLYMVWFRGAADNTLHHIGTSINAILILAFSTLAVRYAVMRKFAEHRRWALRLFLVVSGVWFYRVGLMFWLYIAGGPVGFDPVAFRGPTLTTLSFLQYLIPLAALELYLRARRQANPTAQLAVAAILLMLSVITGIGILIAMNVIWLPRM